MIHTNNPIIKHKAGLLNLAEELGNVSKACKVMGVSRDTFYRYRELAEDGGIDNLINKSRRTPNLKNRRIGLMRPQNKLSLTMHLSSQHTVSTVPVMNSVKKVSLSLAAGFAPSGFATICITSKSD